MDWASEWRPSLASKSAYIFLTMWGWQFRSWCLALGMAPPTPHWVVEGGTQKFQKQKKCWTWQHWDIEWHRNTCVTLTIDVHNELEGKRRSVGSYTFTTSFTVLNCLLTACIIKPLNDDPHWQVNLLAYTFWPCGVGNSGRGASPFLIRHELPYRTWVKESSGTTTLE